MCTASSPDASSAMAKSAQRKHLTSETSVSNIREPVSPSVQTGFFTQKNFYTERLLDTEVSTHRGFYIEKSLYRLVFTRRNFYTERSLYTEECLHTEFFTHRSRYT